MFEEVVAGSDTAQVARLGCPCRVYWRLVAREVLQISIISMV
jgi:hypothetical protein